MIRLLLVFIFIYVFFTAIFLNYAKAFRIKNYVINFIEEQEVAKIDETTQTIILDNDTQNKLFQLLKDVNYGVNCNNEKNGIFQDSTNHNKYCYNGVIIDYIGTTDRVIHYEITTYAYWGINFLRPLFNLNGTNNDLKAVDKAGWKITGEAKVIKRN